MSERWYTTRQAAEAVGLSPYGSDVARLIARGELAATKVGTRWMISAATIEEYLAAQAGVSDLHAALEKLTAVQAENDQLRATIRDLGSSKKTAAVDALAVLSLDESLAILSRLDTDTLSWNQWGKVYAAKQAIQQQIDIADQPDFVGVRPPRVPAGAKRRVLATGIGPVDIWYWRTKRGTYIAAYGGPRPGKVASRGGRASARDAIKVATSQARYEYGKPDRKSSARLRFAVLARDAFTCRYCGRKAPAVELHVDHVIPVALNGPNTMDNLVTACADCNLGKNSVPLAT